MLLLPMFIMVLENLMCPLAAFSYMLKPMSILKPILFLERVTCGWHSPAKE